MHHCKEGSFVIMTDSLDIKCMNNLFNTQDSGGSRDICDKLFIILNQVSYAFSYHLGNYLVHVIGSLICN